MDSDDQKEQIVGDIRELRKEKEKEKMERCELVRSIYGQGARRGCAKLESPLGITASPGWGGEVG